MPIGRNSFIQMTKLSNVKGRITYISSHAKQENLYAVYETTERKFWRELAKCNQEEFAKSGTEGKCIEARELIIALYDFNKHYDLVIGRSGAWGGQGKLETHVGTHILPRPLREAFEKSGDARLSVTDYVLNLRNHGFTIEQDFAGNRYTYHLFPESLDVVVKSIESEEYEEDFFRGYNW